MIRYKMIWSSMIGSLQWEYTWEQANDAMAKDYCRLHTLSLLEHSTGALFDSILLFKHGENDWEFVAKFGLKSRIVVGEISP